MIVRSRTAPGTEMRPVFAAIDKPAFIFPEVLKNLGSTLRALGPPSSGDLVSA